MAAPETNILSLYQHGAQKAGAGQVPNAALTTQLTRPEEFDCRVKKQGLTELMAQVTREGDSSNLHPCPENHFTSTGKAGLRCHHLK